MNRRAFNALKREILELLLRKKEDATSADLARELRLQLTNACDCLLRLKRIGLIDRVPISKGRRGRPKYGYSINPRGKKRLKFWISNSK